MTSRIDNESSNEAPPSKRARVEDDYCKKRTEELTNKIQDLAKSFPELKFILDLSDLSKIVEPTVVKYKNEVEAEKRRHDNEKNSLIYQMPDEILKSCFSFVGLGNYLLIAPVSKKFHHMYKTMVKESKDYKYDKRVIYHTYYSKAATNVSTAKYCVDVIGCNGERQNDYRENMAKIFVEAAYKGQIEILKLAHHFDISYFWTKNDPTPRIPCKKRLLYRPIERIAELGHLNVLQYLHNNFNMHFALPMASRGAAFGGKIHILKWLNDNNILYDLKQDRQKDTLSYYALAGGQLEALQWLRQHGFKLSERLILAETPYTEGNMATAIRTENIELIQYCKDLGFSFRVRSYYINMQCDCLAIWSRNMDLIRYCSELGCEFTEAVLEWGFDRVTVDILKFLRSKSLPWSSETINNAVLWNKYEVLKYAHENGCEWSSEAWQSCMSQMIEINWDIVHYLYENNCPWEPNLDLKEITKPTDRLRLLEFIFSKKLPLDKEVLIECITQNWLEETKLIIENTALEEMPESLTYIAKESICDLETMQYLHSKGISFTSGFLKIIASYGMQPDKNAILKWALENGCPVKDTEELYRVIKDARFYKKESLDLLLCNTKFSGIEQILEKIIKNQLYRQGFGVEQFKVFLNHDCPISPDVVKTIYKHWLQDPQCKNLDDIVAFVSSSKYSEPSIDELYRSYDEGSDSESEEESNSEDSNEGSNSESEEESISEDSNESSEDSI